MGKKMIFYIVSGILVILLVCLGQSISENLNMAKAAKESLDASPSGQASQETVISVAAKPITGYLVPIPSFENAKQVTADGSFSALLVPEHEESDKIDSVSPENIPDLGYNFSGKPRVLIYHTHTTESYRQEIKGQYVENGDSRTNNTSYNVVAVGEALKAGLERNGFEVIHDTTNHEPPKLATAYSRSVETMEKYRGKVDIFIDLHRDSANPNQTEDVVTIDGKRYARIMFVVGTGEKQTPKPNWKSNYAFAKNVLDTLEGIKKGFTRPIRVKVGRYNQHMGNMCLLAEIGHNVNTLSEALNSADMFADAIAKTIK